MDLKGKVAIVTGSSGGIGASIAKMLAQEGVRVVINSVKSVEKGNKLCSEIVSNDGDAFYVQTDVSTKNGAKLLFDKAQDKFGKVDILVNNAGNALGGDFDDVDLWKNQFENILLSQVITTSEFLKVDSKNLRKIVNISSIYGSNLGGKSNYVAYSAAKAGINNMTVNLAKNLDGKFTVNAVAPGWTWSPAWGEDREGEEASVKGKLPLNRFVEPEEIAETVVLLLKNDAITGQIITVDGGASLKEFSLS